MLGDKLKNRARDCSRRSAHSSASDVNRGYPAGRIRQIEVAQCISVAERLGNVGQTLRRTKPQRAGDVSPPCQLDVTEQDGVDFTDTST